MIMPTSYGARLPLFPLLDDERPRTRGDCVDGPRPCPWVGCRHHLAIDISPLTHGVKVRFDPEDMDETCALDVADRGPHKLEEIGGYLNLTRERVRQLEVQGLANMAIRCLRRESS